MTLTSQDHKGKLNIKTGDTLLAFLFLTSVVLTIWAIGVYRLTIIDIKYLFAASALGTIISFAIIFFRYKSTYSIFWTFLISASIGAGYFYFGLLYLNQAFADNESVTEELQIVRTGIFGGSRKGGCFQPYAIVDFHGTQKQLVFYCEYEKTIKNYSKVTLTYSRGLFGFDVIKSKQLTQ